MFYIRYNQSVISYQLSITTYQLLCLGTYKLEDVIYTQFDTKSNKYITIDPGLKLFMACRTNDELISFGMNKLSHFLRHYFYIK